MRVERYDGTVEERTYNSIEKMMEDAEKEAKNPLTKQLTLRFPRRVIPSKRRKI